MEFIKSSLHNNRGMAGKVFLFGLAFFLIIIIIATIVIFPKMSDFFLSRGIEYAAEKTVAVLPVPEGFNPAIHNHDPLIVHASFEAISHTLEIKELVSDSLKQDIVDFMQVFRKCYDDQTIMPEEQTTIITALTKVQMNFLKTHYVNVLPHFRRLIGVKFESNPAPYQDVVGFDSVAIYNDKIQMGMTMPLTVELINQWYVIFADNKIDSVEFAGFKKQLDLIDRFQLKNEFDAITKVIFNTKDFAEFPSHEQFRDNCATIISKLRDLDYDYQPIKNTLKSFVLLWHEQLTLADEVKLDLEPLYQFTVYAKSSALQN